MNHLKQRGFTLLELMITVAILAIILAIGVPSFLSTIAKSQITTQTNNMLAALNTTRMLAIKNNTGFSICASSDGASCTANTAWNQGWIIFRDTNRNRAVDGEAISNVGTAVPTLNITGPAAITFGADGALIFPVPVPNVNNGNIGLRVCKTTTALPANQNARDILINAVGRTHSELPSPAITTAGACP